MNINQFRALSRDDMVAEIIKVNRDAIKGKTRAPKKELIDIFTSLQTSKGDVPAPVVADALKTERVSQEAGGLGGLPDISGNGNHLSPGGNLSHIDPQKAFEAIISHMSPETAAEARQAMDDFLANEDSQPDPYKVAAMAAFKVPYDQVTSAHRDTMKARAFGALYGSGRLDVQPQDPGRAEETTPGRVTMPGVDYHKLEHQAAAMMDKMEIPPGGKLVVPGGVVDEGMSLSSGVDSAHIAPPIGVALKKSRRQILVEALNHLATEQVRMIARYKSLVPFTDRKARRLKDHLKGKIGKFLPRGVSLDEAMAVIN